VDWAAAERLQFPPPPPPPPPLLLLLLLLLLLPPRPRRRCRRWWWWWWRDRCCGYRPVEILYGALQIAVPQQHGLPQILCGQVRRISTRWRLPKHRWR